ncbi:MULTISPECIES: hypothetical protein [unclassified Nocardiopsis]|uniref:hypothetical protein n=1 Tax=unclassified Nocardiopsis TaxID=2649073 RepID=UPI0018FE9871|nr:hypothetical protein [Nocardiopsis sp. TSRI0078]
MPGYVLAEEPDRLVDAARVLQHLSLELLRVPAGVVPPALVAGSPRSFGVRGDQLQHPLATIMTFGDLHRDRPDPRLTDVRHEQADSLIHASCLGE